MQTIYLDISNRGVIPVVYAKQGDVGRKVEVVLTNSGLPYEPEAGSAFSAWFSGASGMGNYTDIGEKSAFSVSGNKVTVELIAQMLQNAGEGFLCLVLSRANGDQLGLWNIRYICEDVPGAGSEPAKDFYTAFSQAVAGLAYPDASLSVAGKAADAAAVGTALAGKAPAGYGYGEALPTVTGATDAEFLSNIEALCREKISSSTFQAIIYPPGSAFDGYSFIAEIWHKTDNSGNKFVKIKAHGVTVTWAFQRVCYMNTWSEPEWENPPMIPGVEYRTTKRHNGNVVYTKAVLCGGFGNKTTVEVFDSSLVGATGILSVNAEAWHSNNRVALPSYDTSGFSMGVTASVNGVIYLISTYDATVWSNCSVTLEYTKD